MGKPVAINNCSGFPRQGSAPILPVIRKIITPLVCDVTQSDVAGLQFIEEWVVECPMSARIKVRLWMQAELSTWHSLNSTVANRLLKKFRIFSGNYFRALN